MAEPITLRIPSGPFVDPKTGVLTVAAVNFLNVVLTTFVQGPQTGGSVNNDPALWDGTSGRLLKD